MRCMLLEVYWGVLDLRVRGGGWFEMSKSELQEIIARGGGGGSVQKG